MRRIQHKILLSISFLLLSCFTFAQVTVNHEHLKSGWIFSKVMSPSKNDAAFNSRITIAGNKPIASCLSPQGLHIGVLPRENRLLRDFFCFTNENTTGGKIAMDLGKVVPVAMINSYSAHGPVGGTTWCNEFDGSRGPQVYTLFGSSSQKPDLTNLSGKEWTKIADVDTRPDNPGGEWQGTYGVNIRKADSGLLGSFRWIVWEVKPTLKIGTKPEWTNTWYCELDVHTPETLKNGGDAILAGTQLEEIIVAFKSHFDIGFTHPAPEIVDIYRTSMIDNALRLIEDSYKLPAEKQFAWTIPSWVAYQILWEGQDSTRRARVIQAMRKGRLLVHGLPVTLQTESLELEDLVFGLSLNKKISEEVGVPMSRSGKLTDVPGHSWVWPTILRNAGIDFLQIGVNPCNERPEVPLLYYWQGPDGSKLLTMYTQGYGSDCEFGHGLYPPKDWPYAHWLALIVATDNAGPPGSKEVENLLNEAARNEPGVKLRFGKMEDFADAIFAEEKKGAMIPEIRADIPDCWIHGMGTMPVQESIAHAMRKKLPAVELLDLHLRTWNMPRKDIQKDVFRAHERSLMYGEHTWGGARNLEGRNAYAIKDFEKFIQTDPTCIRLGQSWQDHADYIHKAAWITDSLAEEAMNQLARNVDVKGKRVVVYNPLPWTRSSLVEIPNSDGRKFLAKDIPACGYKTFPLPTGGEANNTGISERALLENKFLKIEFDRKKGGIISITDKINEREMVDRQAPYAFGQYFYERFDRQQNQKYHVDCSHLNTVYGSNGRCCSGWNIRADLPAVPAYQQAVPVFQSMKIRKTATATEVTLAAQPSGMIQSDVKTTITLPNDFPWFEITVELDHKKPDYWPEAGSIYLPVNAHNPRFRIGRLGATVDPAKDFVRGSNRTYGYVNTGAMISDTSGKGIAICPLDHGIMSFGEKGLCTIDPDYVPARPLALVNMFNNLWTINFPLWIKGSMLSRVRIWAIENTADSSLVTYATEARNPVMVGYAEGAPGKLPAVKSGFKLSRKGILFTAEQNGSEGTLIRAWEQTGTSGRLIITLPDEMNVTKAIPVDLRGTITGTPIGIIDRKLIFDLKAYAPKSFVLR